MNTNKENLPQNRQQVRLNKNELGQLLGQCLKLASENKISAQNTWSLPLIENLPDLIKDSDGDHTNFQRASVTLDAGVKIFSYRVDSVHTETFKMLGTMGRASGPEGEIEGDCVESEGAVNATKRRKRVVELNPDATLESNMEALNVKKFDLAFTVDPLFHKTSAQFDEGGAKGLLLNNLSVYRGCEIVFDSKDVPENAIDGASDQPRTARVDLSSLQGAVDSLSQLSGRERISPTLDEILQLLGQAPTEGAAAAAEEFVRRVAAEAGDVHPAPSSRGMQTSTFSEQHAEAGTSMPAASSLAGEQAESNVVEEGRMAEEHHGGVAPALADYDAAADYNGGGYDDDNCGFGDSGGYDHYSDDNDEQSAMHPQSSAPKSSAKQGKPGGLGEDAIQWLISAGNSSISGRGWAGGSHWRYRAAQQASTAAQGGDEEGEEVEGGRMVKKKATRRKNDPLDFVALLQQEAQPEFPKLKGKGPKRAKTPASTLLPEDHHYKPELLTRYALRPRSTIRPCWAGSAGVYGGGQAGPHQLDFGADNEFGGDFNDGDDHEGADCGGWEASEFGGAAGSTITEGGTELVSAPRRVERVDVNYSRAAKQVDVRALKETLWSGLQQVLPKEQQQEGVVLFQDVLSTVEEHNPAGRVEDLSVHLCFICMLHLANEHGLVVKGVEELNSLAISNISATTPL